MSGKRNHRLIWMNQYVMTSRCTSWMVDWVKFRGAVYSLVSICWRCSNCSYWFHSLRVELWFRNLQISSVFSGAPELPSLIPIICCLSMSGAQDTRVMKEFEIFNESTMLNHWQWIAQENCCQLFDSPETDPAQCISKHPGIDRLSKQYRVDVHQQNVYQSGSNTQSSQTLRATSPLLLSTSRCSQTPLELSKVLSDSAKAFSRAPESTCSYECAFRTL